MPANIYATMTIAATIVSQLTGDDRFHNFAAEDAAEGFALMVITLLTNVAARSGMVRRRHAPRFRWDAASDMGESAESVPCRRCPSPRRSVAHRRSIVDALWWAVRVVWRW